MRKSTIPIVLGTFLILCQALLPAAAWIASCFMPREYTSQATIEVKPNQKMLIMFGADQYPDRVDPNFIADQIQILQSTGILFPVIDKFSLADKWSAGLPAKLSKDEAYQKLLKMLRVSRIKDTALITIATTSRDRQEAADIANAIADIYQNRRLDDLQQQIGNALSELGVEVDLQRKKVKKAEEELQKIRQRDNVNDPNPDVVKTGDADADYLAAKQNYINAKKLLENAEDKFNRDKQDLLLERHPAEIRTRAEPAKAPSSPNVPLMLMIAAGFGFPCALCGMKLLGMGLNLRRQEAAPPI